MTMRLGSKHESEASFSFQINDAVKGDEEYLLAEDDFLRDVNDYTLTTPAPLPRTTVLDHAEPIMLGHQRTRTGDCASVASSPPKLFETSSPTRANVRHHEAAVTRRLKTPKATSTFPPRTTRSTAKRPLPPREMNLPRPEASPAVARLENLRAEIEMLGESDGLSDASTQQQQYGYSSDKHTESGNRSPLNSDIPTPTKLEIVLPIQKEALMSINEPRSGIPILAQSVPAGEPHSSSSPSPCDDGGEPVSPDTDMNAENTTGKQDITNSQNLISAETDKDGNSDRNEVLNISEVETKNDQRDDLVTPLTLSQLSPRKLVTNANLDDQGPVPSSSSALLMSPMRQSRKRPVSAVATDPYNGQSKKGKTVHRMTQNRVITPKEPDSVNPSGPIRRRNAAPKVDVKSHGSVVRRRISSGSRLRSSQLSSSTATAVPLASSSSQEHNQKTARARGRRLVEPRAGLAQTTEVSKQKQKRVAAEMRFDAEDNAPSPPGPEDSISESDTFQGEEVVDQLVNITSKSRQASLSVAGDSSRNNDVAGHLAQQGASSHVNATKSADFQFQFRLEGQKQRLPFERAGPKLRSHSRNQNPPSVSLLRTSKSAMASSSLSNSRSVASMTRSQFKYTHYRPPPDFKAQHSLLESRMRRKENIVPTIPISFELHTDARAREREKYNAMVQEKEKEMELEREAKRREREEQEEKDVRELRRRAVPRANVVPEWYKDAPRRKGHAGRE